MSDLHCRSLCLPFVVLAFAGLAGCGSFDGASNRIASIISPYKSDIVQGNVVTREQLAEIKPGMPKAQVRDILGTALLVSVFHADRWDYVFTLNRQGLAPQSRKLSLYFKGDALERSVADELPSETEFVATLQTKSFLRSQPVLEASEEQLKRYPLPNKTVTPAGSGVEPAPEYPPLESGRP
jgi:outer membrane protein assembly factor BamE